MDTDNNESDTQQSWDTEWSIPAASGSAPSPLRCLHLLPASPRAALKLYRGSLPLGYMYCEPCQSVIRQILRCQAAELVLNEEKEEYTDKGLEGLFPRATKPAEIPAVRLLQSIVEEKQKTLRDRRTALFETIYGQEGQEGEGRERAVTFVEKATIVCGPNQKLEQQTTKLRGVRLGESARRLEIDRTRHGYLPGKFFVPQPLNTSFSGKEFDLAEADIGSGKLLFPDNHEDEQDPSPPQPRRRRVVDSP